MGKAWAGMAYGGPWYVGIRIARVYVLVLGLVFLSSLSSAGTTDDFIAGYASAILEHEFNVTDASIEVRQGIVLVTTKTLGKVDRGKVESALREIPGVTQVEIREGDPETARPIPSAIQTNIQEPQPKWLPRNFLFSPLHADPRWPHFGASYRAFTQGLNLSKVFAGNFGETFSIYRNKAPFGGEWDFGVQAGVFSIFDVGSASIDLVNADYRVGFFEQLSNGTIFDLASRATSKLPFG